MAELSVIPAMPERFSDVDTENWASEALCMLQNADWKTRPHYFVGLEEYDMWRSIKAFHYVMKSQGVPMILHKRNTVRQRISRSGMEALGNVFTMGTPHPESFFELTEGCFSLPMGDTIDAISDAYDSGHPIWIVEVKFKG